MSDRATLKTFFEQGDFPTEAQFADLIDQMVNIPDDNPPLTFSKTLSTAQIKALFTTAIEIVPAQGTDTVIRVLAITAKLIFNSTAYTIPAFSRLEFHETNLAGSIISNLQSTFVSSGASIVEQPQPNLSFLVLSEDVPLVAAYTVGNPTLGDSTIEIKALVQLIQF